MPTLLVIRLHPVEPISVNPDTGAGFSEYLTGLSIAAHEVSFNDPAGSGPAFGTAAYIAPTLPPSPRLIRLLFKILQIGLHNISASFPLEGGILHVFFLRSLPPSSKSLTHRPVENSEPPMSA